MLDIPFGASDNKNMSFVDILIIFIPIIIVLVIVVLSFSVFFRMEKIPTGGARSSSGKVKGVREGAPLPKNAKSQQDLANYYYEMGNYAKAAQIYAILVNGAMVNRRLDGFNISLRYGISLMKTGHLDQAYKYVADAFLMNRSDFTAASTLGMIEYMRGNYDTAIIRFKIADQLQPRDRQVRKYIGLCLFRLSKYNEAYPLLSTCLDFDPDNHELMYSVAKCCCQMGKNEEALKTFNYLKNDEEYGSLACLEAGGIYLSKGMNDEALSLFQQAASARNLGYEESMELQYRTGIAHLRKNELTAAMNIFTELSKIKADYKDVRLLLDKYGAISSNKGLSGYMFAEEGEFSDICRRLIDLLFPKAGIKILESSFSANRYMEIFANIETSKWEDNVLFRFYRSNFTIDEVPIREFYAKMRDRKINRGFCLTAGSFSDSAKSFTEARYIDLVEGPQLEDLLKKLS